MTPARVEELRQEAVRHLRFAIGLYKIQLYGGRHVLHEHPEPATMLGYEPHGLWLVQIPMAYGWRNKMRAQCKCHCHCHWPPP